MELGHTIGICAEVYRATIIFAGRPLEYSHFTGLGSATLLGGIITMLVQVRGIFSQVSSINIRLEFLLAPRMASSTQSIPICRCRLHHSLRCSLRIQHLVRIRSHQFNVRYEVHGQRFLVDHDVAFHGNGSRYCDCGDDAVFLYGQKKECINDVSFLLPIAE